MYLIRGRGLVQKARMYIALWYSWLLHHSVKTVIGGFPGVLPVVLFCPASQVKGSLLNEKELCTMGGGGCWFFSSCLAEAIHVKAKVRASHSTSPAALNKSDFLWREHRNWAVIPSLVPTYDGRLRDVWLVRCLPKFSV